MLLGVDVSKWQGEMEWQRAADAGAKFAFIRAGSISVGGTLYTDYHYMRNVTLAPDHMPVGCYWYFRPQHDPVSQADYFCDLLDGEAWIMPPVLDLETDGGLSMAGVTEAAKSFILQVYNRLQVWPLLYSRSLWLNANVNEDEIWDYVEYWCARYKAGLTGPWSDGYAVPLFFDDWRFWQFSSTGNGALYGAESRYIDLNYFNGDEEAFQEYLGKPFPPSPVLPPSIGVKVNIEIDGLDVKYQGHINKVE